MSNKEILDLFKDCIFDGILTEYDYEDKILYYLPDDFDYDVEYGATKLVLMPSNENFVIKIPFTGYYTEEFDGKEGKFKEIYYTFNGADNGSWDYCKCECERYLTAKQENLEKYFAKTTYLDSINDHPIYIQEKAVIYVNSSKKEISLKEEETTRKKCSKQGTCCFNVHWLNDLLKYCGDKEFEDFLFFIKINGFNDDLHSTNIGYIGNKPVLVDYSGFNS